MNKTAKRLVCLLLCLLLTVSTFLVTANAQPVTSSELKSKTYTDYFSETRAFEDQAWHPTFDNIHVFIYSDDCVYGELPDFEPGFLYKNEFTPGNILEGKMSVLVSEKVTSYWLVNEYIYYSSGNSIYSIDQNGQNKKTILSADGSIKSIVANDTLIYFVVDDVMYRYFAPTQDIDIMGAVPGLLEFTPISNHTVTWHAINSEWSGKEWTGKVGGDPKDFEFSFYIIDSNSKSRSSNTRSLTLLEWMDMMDSRSEESSEEILEAPKEEDTRPPECYINGRDIPHPSYLNNEYWTRDFNACSHVVCDNYSYCSASLCRCMLYTSRIAGSQASQCMGFAYMIYDYIWPSSTSSLTNYSHTFSNAANVASYLSRIRVGSYMRVRNSGHSIIIVAIDTTAQTIRVYDCNWSHTCNIKLQTYTYSQFASTFLNTSQYIY